MPGNLAVTKVTGLMRCLGFLGVERELGSHAYVWSNDTGKKMSLGHKIWAARQVSDQDLHGNVVLNDACAVSGSWEADRTLML